MDLSLDMIIYLRTSPEVAHQRLRSRGREEESQVPLTYVQEQHKAYEDWLVRGKFAEDEQLPLVVILDADQSMEQVQLELEKCLDKLK